MLIQSDPSPVLTAAIPIMAKLKIEIQSWKRITQVESQIRDAGRNLQWGSGVCSGRTTYNIVDWLLIVWRHQWSCNLRMPILPNLGKDSKAVTHAYSLLFSCKYFHILSLPLWQKLSTSVNNIVICYQQGRNWLIFSRGAKQLSAAVPRWSIIFGCC